MLNCTHRCHSSGLSTLLHRASLASYATNIAVLLRDATSTLNAHEQAAVLVLDTFDKALIAHIGGAVVYSYSG